MECGEDVIADNNVVINGLNVGVTSARDANSAIIAFQNALREFNDARTDRDNTFLPIAERCNEASSEDRQAFNQIAKGVSGAVKISASKFKSLQAFDVTRAALTALVESMIAAVNENLDELEILITQLCSATDCDPDNIDAAEDRLAITQTALSKPDLFKAADQARSAYDVIHGQGNVASPNCIQFQ